MQKKNCKKASDLLFKVCRISGEFCEKPHKKLVYFREDSMQTLALGWNYNLKLYLFMVKMVCKWKSFLYRPCKMPVIFIKILHKY